MAPVVDVVSGNLVEAGCLELSSLAHRRADLDPACTYIVNVIAGDAVLPTTAGELDAVLPDMSELAILYHARQGAVRGNCCSYPVLSLYRNVASRG